MSDRDAVPPPSPAARSGDGLWLGVLVLLLPFEPRRPSLEMLGVRITLLEAAAALVTLVLLWRGRRLLPLIVRRPPLPLILLAAYAGAHHLSAALAPAHGDLSFRFALRMSAMALFALAVAALPPDGVRAGLAALPITAALVAILAVLEGGGARFLDPFLAHFREMPFNVGGVRRATGGSEYPNLAAAFMVHGLVAACAVWARRPRWRWVAGAAGTFGGFGLLVTYSRGALAAVVVALLALAAASWRGPARRSPLVGLAALAAAVLAFAGMGEVFRLRLATEGTASWYGARYEPAETSLRLHPGERHPTRVRVTNTGSKTWTAREAFHLSYHWYEVDLRTLEDGGRTVLPDDVPGGGSVILEPDVQAPNRPGRYLLVWDMVHENTSWFSGQGVAVGIVPAAVSERPSAIPTPEVPRALEDMGWQPGRGELWRLAFGMWRERPWTGVGSDNFRRLYGAKAGRPYWDTRVYANSTLLEAAATTGLPGAFTLAGALLAALVASWRAAKGAGPEALTAAALFALALGLAAHGVVDYVLAFTGHYLFLGFVVGAAAGLSRDPASVGPVLARP